MTTTPPRPGAHSHTGRPDGRGPHPTTPDTAEAKSAGHWLIQTRTYDDGLTYRHVMRSRLDPTTARRDRIARLRDTGTHYESGPGWVSYREVPPRHVEPCTVRLDYATEDPDAR